MLGCIFFLILSSYCFLRLGGVGKLRWLLWLQVCPDQWCLEWGCLESLGAQIGEEPVSCPNLEKSLFSPQVFSWTKPFPTPTFFLGSFDWLVSNTSVSVVQSSQQDKSLWSSIIVRRKTFLRFVYKHFREAIIPLCVIIFGCALVHFLAFCGINEFIPSGIAYVFLPNIVFYHFTRSHGMNLVSRSISSIFSPS